MRRLAVLLVALLGCSSASVPESEPAPPSQAPSASPEPAAAVAAPGSPATKAAPIDEVPHVDPPTKAQARVASRAVVKGALAQLAPIVSLSDGRAAILWRVTTDPSKAEASAVLVVIRFADGAWVAEDAAVVLEASTPWTEDVPSLAATVRSEDYDDDGEPEVLVRIRYPMMCPGGGPNTITSLTIFAVSAPVRAVLSTELHHKMDAYEHEGTKATVSHRDTNGDGHRDVEIVYTTKFDGKRDTQTNVWVYRPDDDAWTLTSPEYERWGCDW